MPMRNDLHEILTTTKMDDIQFYTKPKIQAITTNIKVYAVRSFVVKLWESCFYNPFDSFSPFYWSVHLFEMRCKDIKKVARTFTKA